MFDTGNGMGGIWNMTNKTHSLDDRAINSDVRSKPIQEPLEREMVNIADAVAFDRSLQRQISRKTPKTGGSYHDKIESIAYISGWIGSNYLKVNLTSEMVFNKHSVEWCVE